MSKQIRNAKTVQSKSRKNTVRPIGSGRYQVVSATSGNVYDVRLAASSGRCSCDWGKYRPATDQRSACSHVITAMSFAAQAEGAKSISLWTDVQDAARQHRPVVNIGDGVLVTVRA